MATASITTIRISATRMPVRRCRPPPILRIVSISRRRRRMDSKTPAPLSPPWRSQFDFCHTILYVECMLNVVTSNNLGDIMARTTTIQARIDPDIKIKAQKIFKTLNISMSEAISIYLTQVTLHQGIPFEVKIPNELTSETLRKADAGEDLNAVHSVDELFEELDR